LAPIRSPASLAQTLFMAARDAGSTPPGVVLARLRGGWPTLYKPSPRGEWRGAAGEQRGQERAEGEAGGVG
ncbi:MAG: hypothetical protein QXS92_00515, partial [Thermofilum sp.]